jgi:ferric-dicitrate binding protein FerR (iron transport regulator)
MIDDRTLALIMAVLDDEHSPEELKELEHLAATSPEVLTEWTRQQRVKEATSTMTWKDPSAETWDRYWMSVYNKTERKIAWLLMLGGAFVLVAWGLWEAVPHLLRDLFADSSTPVAVRIAVVAVGLGVLLLLVSVIREQITTNKKSPYSKGVSR